MTKDEALKLALEALEEAWYHVGTFQPTEKAIDLYDEARNAIKEALAQPQPWEKFCDSNCVWTDHHPDCKMAQPEQEPVAWVVYSSAENDIVWADKGKRLKQNTPLYTSPPQRKPLTDEQIETIWRRVQANDFHDCVQPFARAIEAAHGIKENK